MRRETHPVHSVGPFRRTDNKSQHFNGGFLSHGGLSIKVDYVEADTLWISFPWFWSHKSSPRSYGKHMDILYGFIWIYKVGNPSTELMPSRLTGMRMRATCHPWPRWSQMGPQMGPKKVYFVSSKHRCYGICSQPAAHKAWPQSSRSVFHCDMILDVPSDMVRKLLRLLEPHTQLLFFRGYVASVTRHLGVRDVHFAKENSPHFWHVMRFPDCGCHCRRRRWNQKLMIARSLKGKHINALW